MLLWTILTLMACAAAVLVAVPLVRRYENRAAQAVAETAVYRDQLAEIERDVASGEITAEQAALARIEVQRRLLAAVRSSGGARPLGSGWKAAAVAATTAFVALASVNIYSLYGSPELASASSGAQLVPVAAQPAAPGGAGNLDMMISRLAARLEKQPADAEGWRLLGWSYFSTGRYEEASRAYARAMALAPSELSYQSAYAEALVQAAGGIVTPPAAAVFEAVLQADAREQRSRFYMALAAEQAGKSSEALDRWLALLADAPADAGWLADVRRHIADLGSKTGRDVAAALGPAPALSPDDVAAGAAMPAGDQQAMIAGMVEGLAARLEAAPRDAEGWKRLIRSRTVLKQPELAREALRKALAAFPDDEATRQDIAGLGRDLGVTVE